MLMEKKMTDFRQVEGTWKVLQALTGIYFSKEMWCFIDALFFCYFYFMKTMPRREKYMLFPLTALCYRSVLSATQALKALDVSQLFKLNALK